MNIPYLKIDHRSDTTIGFIFRVKTGLFSGFDCVGVLSNTRTPTNNKSGWGVYRSPSARSIRHSLEGIITPGCFESSDNSFGGRIEDVCGNFTLRKFDSSDYAWHGGYAAWKNHDRLFPSSEEDIDIA